MNFDVSGWSLYARSPQVLPTRCSSFRCAIEFCSVYENLVGLDWTTMRLSQGRQTESTFLCETALTATEPEIGRNPLTFRCRRMQLRITVDAAQFKSGRLRAELRRRTVMESECAGLVNFSLIYLNSGINLNTT